MWLWRLFRAPRRRFLLVRLRLALCRPCLRACRWSYLLACRCSSSLAWWSSAERLCRSRVSWRAVPSRPVAPGWREVLSRRVSLSRARWPYLLRLLPLRMPCRRRHRPLAPFPNCRGAHLAWLFPRRCGLWLPPPHSRNTEPVFTDSRAYADSGQAPFHKDLLAFLPP